MVDDAEILFERRGAAGVITLNRPKALNAVTHAMVQALDQQLHEWAENPAIICRAVWLRAVMYSRSIRGYGRGLVIGTTSVSMAC